MSSQPWSVTKLTFRMWKSLDINTASSPCSQGRKLGVPDPLLRPESKQDDQPDRGHEGVLDQDAAGQASLKLLVGQTGGYVKP